MAGFDIGSVVAHVKADVTNFKQGMGEAQEKVGGFKNVIGGIVGTAGKLALGLGAVGVAGGLAMKVVADAAGDAEKEMAKFEGLMTSTFGKTPKQFKEARNAALDLSQAFIELGFDDEETAVAMAKSLAVTKDVTSSTKEMGLAADFARLRGIAIGDAQAVLQMAYMGNARVLKQYGIELEDNATKAEIFAKIQQIAGGQANAFAGTYAGAMARFSVEFGNVKEKLGEVFLPILAEVFTQLGSFLDLLANADFGWFNQAVEDMIPGLQDFYGTVQNVINGVINFFSTYLWPFILMLVEFIKQNWGTIQMVTQVLADIVIGIFQLLTAVVTAIVVPFLAGLERFWKENGENIMLGVKATWNIIKGIFEFAMGWINIIVGVALGILTGNWDEARARIIRGLELAYKGIQDVFGNILGFVKGWGGTLLHELVRPFADAWNRISEFIRKIKEGLDFTKKHSPSVVDIVNRGVLEVNKALSGLAFNTEITPKAAALAVGGASQSTNVNQITVDMNGAIISDEYGARDVGEKIGDAIMKKLQLNVRF